MMAELIDYIGGDNTLLATLNTSASVYVFSSAKAANYLWP